MPTALIVFLGIIGYLFAGLAFYAVATYFMGTDNDDGQPVAFAIVCLWPLALTFFTLFISVQMIDGLARLLAARLKAGIDGFRSRREEKRLARQYRPVGTTPSAEPRESKKPAD